MPSIDVNGTELHYLDTGRGAETVLFLHAFPLHSGMWSGQVEALRERFRVIAPDYRGLGKSPPSAEPSTMELLAGDVAALLERLGISRASVVGLSMGGYLAFELQRQAPALFQRLVLADTRAGADTEEGKAGREAFAERALEQGLGWVADELLPKLLRPAPAPEAVAAVRALIAAGTPEGVAAAQRGMARRPDSMPTLGSIACPTLIVVGEEDTLTPPAEAEKMAAHIRGAKLVRIPRAGHIACIENASAFDQALRDFLG